MLVAEEWPEMLAVSDWWLRPHESQFPPSRTQGIPRAWGLAIVAGIRPDSTPPPVIPLAALAMLIHYFVAICEATGLAHRAAVAAPALHRQR